MRKNQQEQKYYSTEPAGQIDLAIFFLFLGSGIAGGVGGASVGGSVDRSAGVEVPVFTILGFIVGFAVSEWGCFVLLMKSVKIP